MEMPKNYDRNREAAIYEEWLEKGYFHATPNTKKTPYTIMIPPPNITDRLHIGHALNSTFQDVLIRFKRMQGFETLWMPGTDHAAISTEVVVMKALAKEGITKESLGREGFLEKLWEWNELYGGTIIKQFKKLGSSCDWDRTRFTMDNGLSDAVLEAFVRLYEDGLIYRGERLINWCIKCGTSISDAEVEHEDREGHLYRFKYEIEGGGHISFATTRPETMLGDTAIAVNPDDERYKNLIGKIAVVPMLGRRIPIISDSYVDMEFGTGAVKITPGHDPNDFEVGIRHNLPQVNILNDDGTINENGGAYNGLTREEARIKAIEEMKELGLFVQVDTIIHSVGQHDRCNTIVEPLLKLQWFVKMEEMAKPALDVYLQGKLRFNKERFGKIYKHWLDNIKDWCISRQLWWGHRLPVYYCTEGHITVTKTVPDKCNECACTDLMQDEDVLDTWFSSALWPFSTLGWPEKTPELKYFYPTNVLVTAQEIIFFWVVRMCFMGLKLMGEIPFTDVFINGTVRDEKGRKMSKSLGNGIDPLELVNEFGADALRLMMVYGNAPDSDMRVYREKLEPARNFINKLWNASRFVLMNLTLDESRSNYKDNEEGTPGEETINELPLRIEDKWILSRLNTIIKDVTDKLEAHEIGMSTQTAVDFLWDEYCDWYVEIVKPRLYSKEKSKEAILSRRAAEVTLVKVLGDMLKILHPIIPFTTEDLFKALKVFSHDKAEALIVAEWPLFSPELKSDFAEEAIGCIRLAVRGVRALRTDKEVPASKKISIVIVPDNEEAYKIFDEAKNYIGTLCGADSVEISNNPPLGSLSVVVHGVTLYVPMESLVDKTHEIARIERETKKAKQEIIRINSKLSNEGFLAKAPQKLVDTEKEKLVASTSILAKLEEELIAVSKL